MTLTAPTSTDARPLIFLSAAETSGDIHAANLIDAVSAICPQARFVGVGGDRMAAVGCEILDDLVAGATMMADSIKRIPHCRRVLKMCDKWMAQNSPDICVAVDSPGFNWHMAAAARANGVKILHYVAPQLWAWAPWRIRKLRRLTDHVACLLPFEQEYFRSRGVEATFVGNPVLDHVPQRTSEYPAPPTDGSYKIAMLPGSRPGEIRKHAQAMVAACELISRRYPKASYVFSMADQRGAKLLRELTGTSLDIEIGRTVDVLQSCHFAVVTSGTVTLETALLGVPQVVFYRVNRFMYNLLGRWLVRIPRLSLVNIVAGDGLIPELMPWFGDVGQLADTVCDQLADPTKLPDQSRRLMGVADMLKAPNGLGASQNTARLLLEMIDCNPAEQAPIKIAQ